MLKKETIRNYSEKRDKQINLRTTKDRIVRFDKVCNKLKRGRTNVINELMENFINENK